MAKINSFEDINAWKKSREFNKEIYKLTNTGAFEKDFDLKRQIRRASVSISSNIAEGFERNTDKEFVYFLICCKGICRRSEVSIVSGLRFGLYKQSRFFSFKR